MKYFDLIKVKLSLLWPMWLVIMLAAFWSVYIQDGQINRDGLLYLKQAYLIAEGNWKEGLAQYPWPFFSVLIAVFHKLTNLHLQLVAHGVDLALFGIATLFYLKTLQLIYNKEKHIIFYGGVILLSFIPIMDDYVGMVLRDHGLWAGCMIGTFFYFKNVQNYSLKNSIIWQFGFLFSGLFRPEGLIFLVLLPLWNLIQNKFKKSRQLLQDFSLSIFFAILGSVVIMLFNVDLMNVVSSSRLTEFLDRPILFLQQLIQPLPIKTNNEYLANLFENYSLIITYSVLISILIFKWIKGIGLLHGGLFFYSFFARKKIINNCNKHIFFFLVVSFILVSINLFNVYVLTNRYWGFHWWWLLILITPVFMIILEDKKIIGFIKKILCIVLAFFILNSLVDKNENLEQKVAEYIKENHLTKIDFRGNDRIRYYVNKRILDILDDQSDNLSKNYRLYKIGESEGFDEKSVIQTFTEIKPKFILIQNVN